MFRTIPHAYTRSGITGFLPHFHDAGGGEEVNPLIRAILGARAGSIPSVSGSPDESGLQAFLHYGGRAGVPANAELGDAMVQGPSFLAGGGSPRFFGEAGHERIRG